MQAKPQYESLSQKYPHTNFLAVNVDADGGIASDQGVKSMPTFMFFKNGTKLGEVIGADISSVESMVKKHGTSSSSGFPSSGGRVLGSSSSSATTYPNLISNANASPFADLFFPITNRVRLIPVEHRPWYFLGAVVIGIIILRFVLKGLFGN